MLVVRPSGEVLRLKVIRSHHCADIQGYSKQLLVRCHKDSALPLPSRLVPKARLSDPEAADAFPLRSEKDVAQVRAACALPAAWWVQRLM